MPITTFERNASIAEMAVEMDRRGAVIERLEADIDTAARALSAEKAAREEADLKRAEQLREVVSALGQEVGRADRMEARATTAEAETARLRERVKALEEALEPFVREASDWEGVLDYVRIGEDTEITVGDLRRATAIRSRENSNE